MILTIEEIESAAKTPGVSWTGYRVDSHGLFTIPILSPHHYQLAHAIEAAVIAKLSQGVEMPEPAIQEKRVCCGNFTTGGEYMGQTETVCCGNPDFYEPAYFTADQLRTVAAAARLKALEEAAVVCNSIDIANGSTAPMICAKAIRALKGTTL